jgi:hypothetical protein
LVILSNARRTATPTSRLGNGYACFHVISCESLSVQSNHLMCSSMAGRRDYLVQLRFSDACATARWNLRWKKREEGPSQGCRRRQRTWTSAAANLAVTWTSRRRCSQVLKCKTFFGSHVGPRSEYSTYTSYDYGTWKFQKKRLWNSPCKLGRRSTFCRCLLRNLSWSKWWNRRWLPQWVMDSILRK